MSLLNLLATRRSCPRGDAEPAEPAARELARRVNDGLQVVLHWHPADDSVTVSVDDARTGDRLRLPVPSERALHAFYHPFTYAA